MLIADFVPYMDIIKIVHVHVFKRIDLLEPYTQQL